MLKIRMLRGMNVRSETSPLRQNKPQVNQKPLNPVGQDDNVSSESDENVDVNENNSDVPKSKNSAKGGTSTLDHSFDKL